MLSYPYYTDTKQCKAISTEFIRSVANGDLDAAKDLSRGKVLLQLANTENLPYADAQYANAEITYLHGNIAKTLVVCETQGNMGKDVYWYDLYLLKDDLIWKVYKVSAAVPTPRGIIINNKGVSGAEDIINKFIKTVVTGQDARQYIAGSALKSYEQIPSGVTESNVNDINLTPIYTDDKNAVYEASFSLDNKQIAVLVTLYKLDTWQIVAITQV